jgi:mono/diheme cytochrome c family protein
MKTAAVVVPILLLLLTACDRAPEPPDPLGKPTRNLVREHADPERLEAGRALFQQHCAACHGAMAEGDPNWRRRNEGGTWPPPALDGTAHAWHHPTWELRQQIRQGSRPDVGNMPPFEAVLEEEEIDAIILWFQSLWPDEVYVAWWEIEQRRGQQTSAR